MTQPMAAIEYGERLDAPGITRVADTFTGVLLRPDPTDGGVHAIFNAPLLSINGGKSFLLLPRVMTRKQNPGIADSTAFFGVYEVAPGSKNSPRRLSSLEIDAIRGDGISHQENSHPNIEDIRLTRLADGFSYAAGATAEINGQPFPACFQIEYGPDGIRVSSPIEFMTGLPPGKNVLMLNWNSAIYRPESFDNGLAVVTQDPQTLQWRIKKEIVFPPLEGIKGKARIGLTGGERIPMANGNFRLIMHVVDHIPQLNTNYHISTYHFRLAEFSLDANGLLELVAIDSKPMLTYENVAAVVDPEGKVIRPDSHKAVIYSVGGVIYQKENGEKSECLFLPVTFEDQLIGLFDIPLELLQLPFE